MSASSQTTSPEGATIEPRFAASAVPTITGVRLSPGDAVDLVNISRSGMLVEGRTRFVPGTFVSTFFDGGFKPAQAKGKVVRCQVSSIVGGALQYQSAIQFHSLLDVDLGGIAAARPVATAEAAAASPPADSPRRTLANRW
jgi:hypothetical protein